MLTSRTRGWGPAWLSESVYKATVTEFADRLCSLVESSLPLAVVSDGSQDHWNVVGPAIITGATRHLRALLALESFRSKVISYQLLRSLFEYVVTYAWIAADPDSRTEEWLKYDFKQRLKADNDFRELGEALLTDEKREWVESQLPEVAPMPDLVSRSRQADEAWAETLDELDEYLPEEHRRFRRLYPLIYRNASQFTHPSSSSVDAFLTRDGDQLHIGEENRSERDPVLTGTGVLASGLAVAATASGTLGLSVDAVRQALTPR